MTSSTLTQWMNLLLRMSSCVFFGKTFAIFLLMMVPLRAEDAKLLLNNVLDRYELVGQFSCGVTLYVHDKPDQVNVLGDICFVRNGKIEVSWIVAPFDPILPGVAQSIVGETNRFEFIEDGVVLRKCDSLKSLIVATTGVSNGVSYLMPSILLGGFANLNLRQASHLEYVSDQNVSKGGDVVIQGITRAGTFTMWINSLDLTINQIRTPLGTEVYRDVSMDMEKPKGSVP